MTTDATTAAPATNRPYAPPANVIAVLHRLRSRNLPDRIDADYLRDAGVSEGTVNRTLFGLRFLSLITDAGDPTPALRSIHTSTDEEYRSTLAALVRDAYADVFMVLDPAEDGQERILNVFRRFTPASQRARMVIFFLGMCREAGIPTLDAPRQRSSGAARPRPAEPTRRAREQRERSDGARPLEPAPRPLGGVPAPLEGLVRSLPAEGTRLTADRRRSWLKMAEATLAFLYPEPTPGSDSEVGGEAEEDNGE